MLGVVIGLKVLFDKAQLWDKINLPPGFEYGIFAAGLAAAVFAAVVDENEDDAYYPRDLRREGRSRRYEAANERLRARAASSARTCRVARRRHGRASQRHLMALAYVEYARRPARRRTRARPRCGGDAILRFGEAPALEDARIRSARRSRRASILLVVRNAATNAATRRRDRSANFDVARAAQPARRQLTRRVRLERAAPTRRSPRRRRSRT